MSICCFKEKGLEQPFFTPEGTSALISDFYLKLWAENKFLLFKSPILWYCQRQPQQTNTLQTHITSTVETWTRKGIRRMLNHTASHLWKVRLVKRCLQEVTAKWNV